MIKKVLIFIIVFIVFYEIYLLHSENKTVKIKEIPTQDKIKDNTINLISPVENKTFSFINNEKPSPNIINDHHEFKDNNVIINNINPNMFGKPIKYEKNNIIVWEFVDPKPWNRIVYKYNQTYPFSFYIKIKIPSLNDYNNWKNIISNIDFNPKTGEIIIPTEDEETALSIINLIISNFKGDLTLEEIISKDLIEISINKAKKYEVVKNKLIEQIMNNLNNNSKEKFDNTETFTTDLANKPVENTPDYIAYEGTEYSFF